MFGCLVAAMELVMGAGMAQGTDVSAPPSGAPATWAPSVAQWIWLPGEEQPSNAYVQFRKTFQLDAPPSDAVLHVSADCRYLLFLNGVVVGRGPVVSDPKYKQVDVFPVAALLREGENVVAAFVLQRHSKTSRLWPVRGGFLLQLDAGEVAIATDASWKARWAIEYKADVPYMTHQYGQQEWCDGRLAPVGWREAGFDDGSWDDALPVPNSEQYWPEALELRAIPHMLREVIHPKRLVSYFDLSSKGLTPEQDHEPARQLEVDYILSSIVAKDVENICHPENGPATFQSNTGDGIGLVVDLGEEMLGYPFIDLECPAGVTVDIGHGEVLSRNRIQTVALPESGAEQRYADRYITRDGRQRFEVFDSKGCRYVEIHLRRIPGQAGAPPRAVIHEVGFVRSRAPIECKTDLSCSDELLNRIFDICRRTADVKCQDWHICDAQREQNQWLEPYQDMLYVQMYGRCDLLRQTLEAFARGQLESGFIPSTLPSIAAEAPTPGNQYIFSTYAYPLIVYLDWLYGGEDARHPGWLDHCARVFDALFVYGGPDGVLVNTPGSHWVEWSGLDARPGDSGRPVKASWEVTFYSAFLTLTLERVADMAQAYGQQSRADDWRTRAAGLRAAADRRYWCEDRGAYIDGIYDGVPSDTVSQSTNAIAILARLGNRERLETALETTADPARCDVASALNSMALYHEAMESLERDEAVPDRIRTRWKRMLDLGATTTWEAEEALERSQGCCFAFSAHPFNYMVRNFLGVVPIEPGYRRFSVRVAPHGLEHAEGRVATPRGYIDVSWARTASSVDLRLVVPEGSEAVVAIPRIAEGAVSAVTLDGAPAEFVPQPVGVCTFLRETMPACRVSPGEHRLSFEVRGHGQPM